jgi:predicted nucleotidyltransferase
MFLGLSRPTETMQFLDDVDGLEIDFTSHEAAAALGRLLKGDGNVLERILSPFQIRPEPTAGEQQHQRLAELRSLTVANLSKRFYRHYSGFFRGMIKQYEKEGKKKIKPILYMYRVALTGVMLLEQRQLVSDLRALLEVYPFARVRELIALKEQAELGTIEDDQPYLTLLPQLETKLAQAYERSPLPDEPAAAAELDQWLRRWRTQRQPKLNDV